MSKMAISGLEPLKGKRKKEKKFLETPEKWICSKESFFQLKCRQAAFEASASAGENKTRENF